MTRIKEPTLFRAKLLTWGFGNDVGNIVNVKEIDGKKNIYYYDTFHRYVYASPGEYEIINKSTKTDALI